eukprot:3569287-Pyramimonas_sp.AAC.1
MRLEIRTTVVVCTAPQCSIEHRSIYGGISTPVIRHFHRIRTYKSAPASPLGVYVKWEWYKTQVCRTGGQTLRHKRDRSAGGAVSYTHLTLPTILLV